MTAPTPKDVERAREAVHECRDFSGIVCDGEVRCVLHINVAAYGRSMWNAALEEAAVVECSRCHAGVPLVLVPSTGNYYHLVDSSSHQETFSVLCASNAIRALKLSETREGEP